MPRSELVYGLHAVRSALDAAAPSVLEVWVQEGERSRAVAELLVRVENAGVAVQRVPRRTLDQMTGGGRHQGIVVRRRAGRRLSEADLDGLLGSIEGPPLLLILDGVQDPHNLGACLRSADAAGAHAVIVPTHRAAGLTPVVSKVASGAAEHIPLLPVTNLARTLRHLKEQGIWVVGTTDQVSGSLFDADLTVPVALVLGAEGQGVRRLTRELCDVLVSIPMHGVVESLNVSAAAAICLYEAVRQRRRPASGPGSGS